MGKGVRLSLGLNMGPRGRHLSVKHQTLPRALRGAGVIRIIMLLLGNVEGGSARLLNPSSLHEKLHATHSLQFARVNSLTFV